MDHRGAEDLGVPRNGRLQVADRNGHVVDLGQQSLAHTPCLRNRVMRSSPTLARSSGSSMPETLFRSQTQHTDLALVQVVVDLVGRLAHIAQADRRPRAAA